MLRRRVLGLVAAFVAQLWITGPATAQETTQPEAQPAPATPEPATPPTAQPSVPQPAEAAPPAAAPTGRQTREEEIVVTGSRIRRKELNTPAPVTVVTHDQIIQSGRLTIAEYLQILPEQGNSLNPNGNNGSSGQTTVNLRGLDSTNGARTLVLLNGRRMITAGPGATNFVDLSTIPSSAVERIEILKDGASAIYGADAIAGVVNIITRKGFNGAEAVANLGISGRQDAQTTDLAVTAGSKTEKSSSLLSATYYTQRSVLSAARPWSKYALAYDYYLREASPGGSGTLPEAKVPAGAHRGDTTGLPPDSLFIPLINQCYIDHPTYTPSQCPAQYVYDANATYAANPAGGFYPWRPTTGSDVYNFAAENYMVTPQDRVGLFGTADSKLGDVARAYVEGSFVNRKQSTALAPEPMWGTVYYDPAILISGGNEYNKFDVDVDFRRRLVEANRRMETRENSTFRGVAGLDGTLGDYAGPMRGWFWDVSFNYGRDVGSDEFNGNLNSLKIRDALGPSFGGKCYATYNGGPKTDIGSYSGEIPGCVPLNLLGEPYHSISAEQLNALTFSGPSKAVNQQAVTSASIQGELFSIAPDKPAQLLVGGEYRRFEGSNIPDPFTVFGYTSGQQAAPVGGAYDVKDAFAELVVPILSGIQWAQYLEASAAARVFKYNIFSADQTYKFGLIYRPVQDVRLRGTYATAFRAPSIGELYGGTGLSADTASDPCDAYAHQDASGTWIPNMTPSQIKMCTDRHAPAPAADGSGGIDSGQTQLQAVIGSNGGLKPEKAKTFTVGAVYEPTQVKGLSLTVDFWNIEITNPISRDGAQVIVNSCILRENTKACDRIERSPVDGTFIKADDLLANQGKETAQGIDAALRYQFPLPVGRLGVGVDSTFLIKHDQTKSASLDGLVVHGRGTYDLYNTNIVGGLNPTVKFNAGVQYFLGGLNAGILSRYIGGFKECAGTTTGLSYGTDCSSVPNLYHNVPANVTFDGTVGYTLTSGVGKTSVNVGIVNAFDSKPPVLYSNITQWSDWNYDFLGRRYYAQLVHNF